MRNFWGVKPLNINRQPFRFGLDIDRDRVPDWKDCQWWNPYKQHLTPRRKAEIDALPIRVASEEYPDEPVLHFTGENVAWEEREEPELIPLASKEAKEKAPITTAQIYSTFNRHPELISRVKKVEEGWQEKRKNIEEITNEKTPNIQYLSSPYLQSPPKELLAVGLERSSDRTVYSQGGRVVLGTQPFGFNEELTKEIITSKVDYPMKKQDIAATIIHHELTHEEQALRDDKSKRKYQNYDTKHVMRGLENPYKELMDKEIKTGQQPTYQELKEAQKIMKIQNKIIDDRYRAVNPYESNADRVALEYANKRLKKVPEKEVYEGFRNVIE
jgi:hypothetical protein